MKTGNGCIIQKFHEDNFSIESGAQTNYFVDGNNNYKSTNAPFYYEDVTGDFMIEVMIKPDFAATYDAGAILIHESETSWIKAAFELTDLGYPSIVSVVTRNDSDDCNGESVGNSALFVRVNRKNQWWAIHHSIDGINWKMHRYFQFTMHETVKAGVIAQSPTGKGCKVEFSDLKIAENKFTDIRQCK